MKKKVAEKLYSAAQRGDIVAVNKYIERGADVEAQGEYGNTSLMAAVERGHENVVDILMAQKADVNKRNNDGATALHFAVKNGQTSITNKLVAGGADVNVTDHLGNIPLRIAVQKSHEEIVKVLIDKGADVNIQNRVGRTSLMIAAEKGDIKITKALINNGADVNVSTYQGMTAFHFASKFGHTNIVDALIGAGAQINQQMVNKFLIPLIADKESRKDPLLTAMLNGYDYIAKALVDKGGDVSAQHNGQTVLMVAAENGLLETVNSLIAKGADIHVQLKEDEETALTLVREELVLIRLVQSSETLSQKTKLIKEEDVRAHLNPDLVSVIQKACPEERFSEAETTQMKELFQNVPVYKIIREKLLKAGGCDVRQLNENTK